MSQAEAVQSSEQEWEPRILTFCCNWCSYAGADSAGTSRMQYPTNMRIIRIMCSGRLNPMFIVKGFLSGADMVMMLGCHFGDCHYLKGNFACNARMTLLIRSDQVQGNDGKYRQKGKRVGTYSQ
jgi:F420-non-reducing hydrogenase iron-sulfur subunit